ncbi:MAG: YggS family pyridoxal phosphate enzyme [Candidatus Aminicenantes bacterium 4484_214]|nr:MAG: YggS family pyridoxal phosphate enzyme [Candidatus Aminicenantes bacterium 4484_214]RLE10093.1 MAG: YggS family pyridoxal phosphate-dependent enzyme [Candidatus Aminicenantes bacterium]
MSQIEDNVKAILAELPPGVELVAAAKARTPNEIQEAIKAGVKIIGENYIQEAINAYQIIGRQVKWHFIGHLQRNKVKKAIDIFDLIETLDSLPLAKEIDKRCGQKGKVMPVLIEINSGREPQKFGVLPEDVEDFVRQLASFSHLRVWGVMTMGPAFGDPEDARPYFQETARIFNHLKSLSLPHVEMKYLSMGMSNSYQVAIEEGANLVRLGTVIFGPRHG